MHTSKQYEILNSLPAYGPMYIPVSESGELFYSEGFPIRFYKTDGKEWVANFRLGWTGLKQVIELEKTSNLLIITSGTCYLMNPNESKPASIFGVGYCDIFQADNGRFVLQDQTDLTIIEPDGTHWNSERISWDGLKELKIENNKITGFSYDPHDADEWVAFSYDLKTRTLTGGSYPLL